MLISLQERTTEPENCYQVQVFWEVCLSSHEPTQEGLHA